MRMHIFKNENALITSEAAQNHALFSTKKLSNVRYLSSAVTVTRVACQGRSLHDRASPRERKRVPCILCRKFQESRALSALSCVKIARNCNDFNIDHASVSIALWAIKKLRKTQHAVSRVQIAHALLSSTSFEENSFAPNNWNKNRGGGKKKTGLTKRAKSRRRFSGHPVDGRKDLPDTCVDTTVVVRAARVTPRQKYRRGVYRAGLSREDKTKTTCHMYERQPRVTAYRFNGRLISVSPLLLTPACSFPRARFTPSLLLTRPLRAFFSPPRN